MSYFKSLPIDQECIERYVQEFLALDEHRIDNKRESQSGTGARVFRYVIGKALTQSSTVDFMCNKDGTTTVHYKLGKNQELGLQLAEYVKYQVNPNEFESIEMTLQHLKEEDVLPLIQAMKNDAYECGGKMFRLLEEQNTDSLLQLRITSVRHCDSLVIKYHKRANSLQVQGKPLFVYKRLSYHFVDFLDILGIEKVLHRRDESRAEVVSTSVAEHILKDQYPFTFERTEDDLKKLILSGMCISLASPKLPDYSMLVYPDLRALEGALHHCLKAYGLYSSNYTDDGGERVGVMFRKLPNSTYTLKADHVDVIKCPLMIKALADGYNQYSGKRHPLFHVEEEVMFSTFIRDLNIALTISSDTRKCIEELYKARPV
ncbi:MAG: hypothetical protein ACJAS1_003347 [Oleiphilaceae bacterium]|jgi:hypothetical protein